MKLVVVFILIFLLFVLVKKRHLQVDLSFPWLFALVLLGALSMHDGFILWIAGILDISYQPIAIILIAMFLLLALTTVLAIAVSKLRHRQIMMMRQIAQMELNGNGPASRDE
ncbi:MAG: DUF2304 domain-containing protein [Minwuiales bacterium]|nr:DUF2304 domain-containing protein [Minwuiales bacterium]